MARPKRFKNQVSVRLDDEHQEVLDGLRDRLEAHRGKRQNYGDVLRWVLEQPTVRRLVRLKKG